MLKRRAPRGPGPPYSYFIRLVVFLELFVISVIVADESTDELPVDELYNDVDDSEFQFTSASYNGTINENSVGKVYVEALHKMGIFNDDPDVGIKYKIVSGDPELFFKAESEQVGNFVFLLIRTRTSNINVLNRERIPFYNLKVRATFRDSDKHRISDIKASTVVHVQVVDTNDLDPFFNPSFYRVSVPEDQPLHTSLLTLNAEDADSGVNGEIYYSIAEDTDTFTVHPVSGVVSLARQLAYAEKTTHRITVEARDRGSVYSFGPRRVDTATLAVTVEQVNKYDPVMTIQHLPEVVEQSNTDIYAIIHVKDPDPGRHGEVASLEIIEGDPDAHFRVTRRGDRSEFNVEVLKLLDREVAPSGYNLTLKATDNGTPPRSSYKEVHVRLVDLNDHPPVFDKEEYEVRIPESALPNTPLTRLKVTDLDSGRNAKVILKISAGNKDDMFRIDPVSGVLFVNRALDAEVKSRYALTVSALDMANAGMRKQSSARVSIFVEDVNDNNPEFEVEEKEIFFNENEPAGTRVIRVNARDLDSGENARITYSIANINADELPFEIDHFSGVIKSRQVIDYESDRRDYDLRVRASDWGTPFIRQSEMKLTVHVKDINDNRPQFEREYCVGKVSRSLPLGGEIITLSALDFDAKNMISYRVVSGNADGCFHLDETTGVLSAKCDIGRLPTKQRVLNVTATDGQHFADVVPIELVLVEGEGPYRDPGLDGRMVEFSCRNTNVALRLTKLMADLEKNNRGPQDTGAEPPALRNVHQPTFQRLPKSFYLNETDPVGTEVFKVVGEDLDPGYDGSLIYVISGGDPDAIFEADMYTGSVRLMAQADREKTQDYMLNVTACDQGRPHKCASILSHVIVLDQNDNAPVFLKSAFSFFFPENTRNGTPVVTLNATDLDSGPFGQVTYILETETEDFALDSNTGLLIVSKELDRETKEFYDLTIRAVDGDLNKPLSALAKVRVRVLDVNDVAPKFTSKVYYVKAREDLPLGTVVGFVDAFDPDLYQGGQITYSIDYGDEGMFYTDKFTGAIKIKKKLDYETKQLYNMTILAIDGGSPSLVSVASFIVEVLDVNENLYPPRFDSVFVAAKVPENLPAGSLVTKISATDFDSGPEDSRISYSIRGGDGLNSFTVDDGGNVRTSVVLDRESKKNYWLTVYAQDHGAVPLFSKLEVYVEVLNINDNVPLTMFPVYFPSVMENSKPSTPIVTLEAFDGDLDPEEKLVYEITSGDPQSLFTINSATGLIATSQRKLDRETQREHELEVRLTDSGKPPLSSTTKVIITVLDENDNAPQFLERSYKIKVPELVFSIEETLQQDQQTSLDTDSLNKSLSLPKFDPIFENTTWEIFRTDDLSGEPVFRVIAFDKDEGLNSELSFSINNGEAGTGKFQMDPLNGQVYATTSLLAGEQYQLLVKCKDNGNPQLSDMSRVSIEVIPAESDSNNTLRITEKHKVEVFETDPVGHLVILIQAESEKETNLFYAIVDGNDGFDFSISRDKGSLLIARPLNWERRGEYRLNVSITDGAVTVFTLVHVTVINVNEERPKFSSPEFLIDVPENVSLGALISHLTLTNHSSQTKKYFSLHAAQNQESLQIFKVDPLDGTVTLARPLDREQIPQHILTVAVKNQATLSKKNFARLVVNVQDNNDHSPLFLSQLIQTKLFETAEVGNAVVQALAVDNDYGENGVITYSILSGNVGNAFTIDPDLGILRVHRRLDMKVQPEYMLVLKATDHGLIPLSATVPVHILLTMADSAAPRFLEAHYATEVYENLQRGHFVIHVEARSQSSLFYEITAGNEGTVFQINPSTGIIMTHRQLDFEQTRVYNLTVQASNMVAVKSTVSVEIHILDINDNAPKFSKNYFEGNISETAAVGSLVLVNNTTPLVIKATDRDSGLNSLLMYEILEEHANKHFTIDSSTGAVRTVLNLDYETQSVYEFNVRVSDMGKPRLSAETTAHVKINVKDENDSPPIFAQSVYEETLLLPTFENVSVVTVHAQDPDTGVVSVLKYAISGGNPSQIFGIDELTGRVFVKKPDQIEINPRYSVELTTTDGKYTTQCRLQLEVRKSENSGLAFSKSKYYTTVLENSTKADVILVVNVLGSALNENLEFRILNPTDRFAIGSTSGALSTTGVPFDREEQENYELILEVRSQRSRQTPRIAHVIVDVTVMDLNDNPPIFVNKPYYAVISREVGRDTQVIQVTAVDLDKGSNGDIYYQLVRGNGDLFRVGRKSGRITLKRDLNNTRDDYILTVAAYDGGSPPYSSETQVLVKVVEKSVPTFTQQSYRTSVSENIETFSPILSAAAVSPNGGELIYTVEAGNEQEIFSVDYSEGVLFVAEGLDYEAMREHQLTVRAMDTVSSGYSESIIFISVEDVNDNTPQFLNDSYSVIVSESQFTGASILRVLARDLDSGLNQEIEYSLKTDAMQLSEMFWIDPGSGEISLLRNLDYEREKMHTLRVFATDKGAPARTGETLVYVTVVDSNDNPPTFEEADYTFHLSKEANRGQFVGKVRAVDPDYSDNTKLLYSIIGGNEHQIFSMETQTGQISLINLHNFDKVPIYLLNITVSDGVYATNSKVKINLYSGNKYNPSFPKSVLETKLRENSAEHSSIIQLSASDLDGDILKYVIISDESSQLFDLDPVTGILRNLAPLDRETKDSYDVPVMVSDTKGRNGFAVVKITVTDENDNGPVFPLSEYKASMPANLTAGSLVVQVAAQDKDLGRNGKLKYSIYDARASGVDNILKINKETGQLYLKTSARELENQVYQFFVRAEDGGKPSLSADVPVEVYIMSPLDQPPTFEKRDSVLLVAEESPVGTTICQLSAVSSAPDTSILYRMASSRYAGPDSPFQVDNSGRVIISNLLDREIDSVHNIVILAETDSSPSLTVYTELTIQILDANDNYPVFTAAEYKVTVLESVEPHTSIMQVLAKDLDFANNGEVTYSFADESKQLAHLFNIDPHNGWISTQGSLDFEQTPLYVLSVVATDNGKERRRAETKVHVIMLDANDNPPEFSQRLYSAAVNEGALPGTIIFQLQVQDKDTAVHSPVTFAIASGDPQARFNIKRNGEVYVARSLDREDTAQYRLEVLATDGLFVTSTRVSIEILDDNDSPPECVKFQYRLKLSEGVVPGTKVVSVLAADKDEGQNARQVYSLSGETRELFNIDEDSGLVSTALLLDREKTPLHSLLVKVADAGHPEWFCESRIEVRLTDANDNSPEWDTTEFSASVREDASIGQIITKVHATDPDLGENRRITYSFLDSADGHFDIEPKNGIISLAKGLDRELVDLYNLTVRAMDSGRPRLFAVTNLIVRVLDVNDNPPEFASKYYFASVLEGSSLGTDVVHVLATSRDTGVNAEITYSITGGNQHKKFAIDALTGLVSVAGEVDHERAREYFLTIEARDGGTPPLNNHATVNITVLDANDNTPVFTQTVYAASLNENSRVGKKIITLTATDLDKGDNGRIVYGLVHGDRLNQFQIDPETGELSLNQSLDREMVSSYVLEVQAHDCGDPILSSSVLVNIRVEDANDNPPIFPEGNYSVYVQEDKPYGHILLMFSVTDADEAPNGVPFSWDIRAGNEEGGFRMVQDGSLRTAKKFNHKLRNQYSLQIRVFDNGAQPLYSDTYVTVNIIEESKYPPIISPLEIEIFSYQDEFPGSVIGRVHSSDQDPYDVLGYELMTVQSAGAHQPHVYRLFEMDRRTGTLVATQGLDVGEYSVNVSVSDGKFISFQSARVTVNLVTDSILRQAVILKFSQVTPEEFISNYRKSFVNIVKSLFNVRSKDVEVLGLQPTFSGERGARSLPDSQDSPQVLVSKQPNLELLLAVRRDESIYYSRDEVRKTITGKLAAVSAQVGLNILEVKEDTCEESSCVHGRCADEIRMSESQVLTVSTDIASLVFQQFEYGTICECKVGFSGKSCNTIANECHREPCPSFKVCVPESSPEGYSCQCPPGLTGAACNVNITTCQHSKCNIINPIQFSGRSFSQYLLKRSVERHLSVTIGFRTLYSVATLMYSHGLVDYSILEISEGRVQYRFNFGSGEGLVRLNDKVANDGLWHEVKLERHGNSAEIAVDGKWRVHGAAPGLNDVLNLEQSDVYFGAVVSELNGEERSVSRGFVGCMDDIKIDHEPIPLHINTESPVAKLKRLANIEFKCEELSPPGVCGSHPCKNGGSCLELQTPSGFACTCPPRFSGAACEYDLDPCASNPCLHSSKCMNLKNDFHCECPPKLSGKRCHYGKYCNPNPCENKGVCEEGLTSAICKCRGFTGEFCTIDVNECRHQNPCHNGGTCVNSPGGFHCICPGNSTGVYCSESAQISLVPRNYALTLEEVVGIILSLFIIVILVAIFVACKRLQSKRQETRTNTMNLIQNDINRKQCRNGAAKLNNYELTSRELDLPLLPQQRPVSISPSVGETPFNYMDTVRSYGSAADELETLPRLPNDFIQNIQKPVATVAPSMMSSRDMNLKDNYFLRKKSPGLDSTRPSSSSSLLFRSAKLRVNLPAVDGGEDTCQSELSMEEDCQRYHWDCSDWAHQSALPALSELPNGEVLEAASWMSDLHSTSPQAVGKGNLLSFLPTEPVDPTRDIETLPEEEEAGEEDGASNSECDSQLGAVYPDSPMHQTNKSIDELMMMNGVNFVDDDEGSVDIPNSYDYQLHLNNYLPTYHLGSDPDTDEATPMMGRHPMGLSYAQQSPDLQRYASLGISPHPGLLGKQSLLPARGTMLSPTQARGGTMLSPTQARGGTMLSPTQARGDKQEDPVCDIEDSGEESNETSAFKTTPRVTQV